VRQKKVLKTNGALIMNCPQTRKPFITDSWITIKSPANILWTGMVTAKTIQAIYIKTLDVMGIGADIIQ
jgi:hypothetical protein